MITLTQEYQLISTIKLTYGEIRTYAKYRSQDISANKTYYVAKSVYHVYSSAGFIAFDRATAYLNSASKNYGYTRFNAGDTELLKIEREMVHNPDGTSLVKNIRTGWNASFGGSGDTNVNILMPKIPRQANVTKFEALNVKATKVDINWETDKEVDEVKYSLNNENWILTDNTGRAGTFTISELKPNAKYQVKLQVRAKDSKIVSESNTIEVSTTGAVMYLGNKRVTAYYGKGGKWHVAIPYLGKNGKWKEGK